MHDGALLKKTFNVSNISSPSAPASGSGRRRTGGRRWEAPREDSCCLVSVNLLPRRENVNQAHLLVGGSGRPLQRRLTLRATFRRVVREPRWPVLVPTATNPARICSWWQVVSLCLGPSIPSPHRQVAMVAVVAERVVVEGGVANRPFPARSFSPSGGLLLPQDPRTTPSRKAHRSPQPPALAARRSPTHHSSSCRATHQDRPTPACDRFRARQPSAGRSGRSQPSPASRE